MIQQALIIVISIDKYNVQMYILILCFLHNNWRLDRIVPAHLFCALLSRVFIINYQNVMTNEKVRVTARKQIIQKLLK